MNLNFKIWIFEIYVDLRMHCYKWGSLSFGYQLSIKVRLNGHMRAGFFWLFPNGVFKINVSQSKKSHANDCLAWVVCKSI